MIRLHEQSVTAQVGAYHAADIIISPHGAAMANLLWVKEVSLLMSFFCLASKVTHHTSAAMQGAVVIEYLHLNDDGWAHEWIRV